MEGWSPGRATALPDGGVDGPLRGVTVLDLTRALAGPYATLLLGDLGARVIKIERPGTGDDTRSWGPPFVDGGGGTESTYFLSVNRNKESVTLDLGRPDQRELLLELVGQAQILVENFRPGVLDRLGLDTATLQGRNPALVIVSITGFGHDGPDAHRVGYDQIAQGEGGLMSLTGADPDQPTKVGAPISDVLAGMFAATGALAALREADRTGRGDVVRTSLLAATVAVHAYHGTRWLVAGELPRAVGNRHPTLAPYGAYRTGSGLVQLGVGSEDLWRRFAPVVGLDPADPRFSSNASRLAHQDELSGELEAALAADAADAWVARLVEAGVPAGLVRDLEAVYASEQVRSQGLLLEVDHPGLGALRLTGSPLRFDRKNGTGHRPPPRLGEHTDQVLGRLGPSGPAATPTSATVVEALADPGSFVPLPGVDPRDDPEAVVVGLVEVDGRPVVLIVSDYGVAAGTMGAAEGLRVAEALEAATARRLPAVAVTASGGVRLQEGPGALAGMAATTAAARRHAAVGGLLVTYWAHPSTGGVLGSWGAVGDLRYAQPGATVALTGPRVARGFGFPGADPDWAAESLLGVALDEVCDLRGFRDRVAALVRVLANAANHPGPAGDGSEDPGDAASGRPERPRPRGWEAVATSRETAGATVAAILADGLVDATWLQGAPGSGDDPRIAAAVGSLWGWSVVVVAQVRDPGGRCWVSAAGLRKARRAVALAGRLGLPLVSLVDTEGPAAGPGAEQEGLALELGGYLGDMAAHPAPSVGLLAGEGGGGVALAPLVADRVVAATDAWLAPLSPEGAATVLHRDPSRAPEVAEHQRLGADRLAELGLVDEVVADDHPSALAAHRDALGRALLAAWAAPAEGREQRRGRRYREALRAARGQPGGWGGDQHARRRG